MCVTWLSSNRRDGEKKQYGMVNTEWEDGNGKIQGWIALYRWLELKVLGVGWSWEGKNHRGKYQVWFFWRYLLIRGWCVVLWWKACLILLQGSHMLQHAVWSQLAGITAIIFYLSQAEFWGSSPWNQQMFAPLYAETSESQIIETLSFTPWLWLHLPAGWWDMVYCILYFKSYYVEDLLPQA